MVLQTGRVPAILVLFLSALVLVSPATAHADCDAIYGRLQSLDGQISQEAADSNELMARMNAALEEFGRVNDQDVERGSKAEGEALQTMKQLMGQALDLCQQRVQVHNRLIGLWGDGYSAAQDGVSQGCFESDALAGVAQSKAGEENALQSTQGLCSSLRKDYAKVNSVIADRQNTAGQNDDPPTVRIVNAAGMPICIHPGGMNTGLCIGPGKERVYNMDKLTGLDMDSGQRTPTKTIMVVGGGHWVGSPYTEYQDMTLCTKQRFGHESGEVVWRVSGSGVEGNCGLRGYHQ